MAQNKKIALVIERILLHLMDFKPYEGERDGKMDLTQIGIANAVGIKRANIVQDMKPLLEDGSVEQHKVHLPGIKIKRNNYHLTHIGYERARVLMGSLGNIEIDAIDMQGEKSRTAIAEISARKDLNIRFVDVVRETNSTGLFDCREYQKKRKRPSCGTGRILVGIPGTLRFFGRAREMEGLSDWLGNGTVTTLAMTGIPGIGKTSLASRFISEASKDRRIHYFAIKPWCSLKTVLLSLSAFLEDGGNAELRSYLEDSKSIDLSEVELILSGIDLNTVMLAYDDCHNATDESLIFLRMLHGTLRGSGGKLLVMGRAAVSFYNRKDVSINRSVLEMTLEGLDERSTLELAREAGVPDAKGRMIFSITHGHPLFVELLAAGKTMDANSDIEEFINHELLPSLVARELDILNYMSVHRYAVHREALAAQSAVLSELMKKSIIRPVGEEHLEVVDIIKTAIYRGLSAQNLEKLHSKAAEHYLESFSPDNVMEAIHHLNGAGRHSDVCRVIIDREEKLLNTDWMEELARMLGPILNKNIGLTKAEKAHLLYVHGHALSFIGEWDDAIMSYNRAMVMASSDDKLRILCKSGIGEISLARNNYSVAQSLFEDVLAWAEKNDDMDIKAEANYQLGSINERLGNNELALAYFEMALKIAFKTYNRNQMAKAYYGQGRIYHRKNEFEQALKSKEKALEIVLKIGNKHIASKVLTSIGFTYEGLKKLDEEIKAHEQAITLARESGAIRALAYALSNAGAAYLDKEELDASERYLEESAIIFEKVGENHMIATIILNKANIALFKDDLKKAVALFNDCEALLIAIENDVKLMDSYFRFGLAHKKMKLFDEAKHYFKRARAISIKLKDEKSQRQIDLEISQISK